MTTPSPAQFAHVRLAQALRQRDVISIGGNKVVLTKDATRLLNNDAMVMLSGHIVGTSQVVIHTVLSDRQFKIGG